MRDDYYPPLDIKGKASYVGPRVAHVNFNVFQDVDEWFNVSKRLQKRNHAVVVWILKVEADLFRLAQAAPEH